MPRESEAALRRRRRRRWWRRRSRTRRGRRDYAAIRAGLSRRRRGRRRRRWRRHIGRRHCPFAGPPRAKGHTYRPGFREERPVELVGDGRGRRSEAHHLRNGAVVPAAALERHVEGHLLVIGIEQVLGPQLDRPAVGGVADPDTRIGNEEAVLQLLGEQVGAGVELRRIASVEIEQPGQPRSDRWGVNAIEAVTVCLGAFDRWLPGNRNSAGSRASPAELPIRLCRYLVSA